MTIIFDVGRYVNPLLQCWRKRSECNTVGALYLLETLLLAGRRKITRKQ